MEKKYFEIINELEKALPQTTDLDYTKVSPEELWKRVYEFLKNCELLPEFNNEFRRNINPEDIKEIEIQVLGQQEIIYKMERWVKSAKNGKEYGFDQNNYAIADKISYIKEKIMYFLQKKRYKPDEHDLYGTEFGTVEEIKKHISHDNITDFITKRLFITKEKGDGYNNVSPFQITREIMEHFGIFTYEYANKHVNNEIENKIEKLIEDVIQKSASYGRLNSHGSDGKLYDSVEYNSEIFNNEIQKSIEKIVSIIEERANKMLSNRIEQEKMKEERKKERAGKSVENNNKQNLEPEWLSFFEELQKEETEPKVDKKPKDNSELSSESDLSNKINNQNDKPTIQQELEKIMLDTKSIIELTQRNEEIAKKIITLNENIEKLKAELIRNNEEISRIVGKK